MLPLLLLLGVWIAPTARAADGELTISDLRVLWSPVVGKQMRDSGQEDDTAPAAGIDIHTPLSGQRTLRYHQRIGLGYYRSLVPLEASRGSFIYGAEASWDRQQTQAGSTGRTWVIDAAGGWAWALTPAWHVEEALLVGAGRSQWDLLLSGTHFDDTDAHVHSDYHFAYEYGLRLGTTYAWHHVVAGLDLRYMVMNSRQQFNDLYIANGITETTALRTNIRTEGLGGTLGLGYRF
jgi:hypothetical protein